MLELSLNDFSDNSFIILLKSLQNLKPFTILLYPQLQTWVF